MPIHLQPLVRRLVLKMPYCRIQPIGFTTRILGDCHHATLCLSRGNPAPNSVAYEIYDVNVCLDRIDPTPELQPVK